MASTYSDLKIELIATGEQSGTWGTTTNTNLGTALEEAIVGRATANFTTNADLTLTLTDTNATQVARHYILNVTSGVSLSTTRNLIVPTIDKPYIIENNTTGGQSIVVKTSAGTGVTVPNGKKVMVYANSTNVVAAQDHIPSLTLGSALPVASGGTGITSFGTGVATALGQNVSGSGSIALTTSPVFTTPNLGTPSAITLTSATGLPLSTGVTGQLPLANGGTGANLSDPNADRILFWDDSANSVAFLTAGTGLSISGTTISATGSGGTVTSVAFSGGTTGFTVTGSPITTSGTITLAGTLNVANGGTGATSLTSNNVILGNGTSAVQFVAPGTNGNVLTSNGTTWTSAAPAVTLAGNNAFTGANTFYNSTGQTFGTATSTQDGVIVAGRAGGSSSYRVTLQPGTLSASRTLTLPDNTGTVLTTGAAVTVAQGGTGATTLTGLVLGNGTSAFTTVTAPSGTVVGTTDTQTLTNKRVNPRVSSTASISSPLAWNSDNFDMYAATAQAGALTINADSGTPVNGQKIIFRFKDNGTARALTWTTGSSKSFQEIGITLPTTTVINKTIYVGCIYNAADDRWDAVATVTQA